MELGWKFWAGLIGIVIAGGFVAIIVFRLFGLAWQTWGFWGGFAAFAILLILGGWLFDRREARRRSGIVD